MAASAGLFTRDVDAWWRRGSQYRPGRGRDGTMRLEGRVGGRVLEVYDEFAPSAR